MWALAGALQYLLSGGGQGFAAVLRRQDGRQQAPGVFIYGV